MATRRRTANWIQPPKKKKKCRREEATELKGACWGGGSRYHFTLDYSEMEGAPRAEVPSG